MQRRGAHSVPREQQRKHIKGVTKNRGRSLSRSSSAKNRSLSSLAEHSPQDKQKRVKRRSSSNPNPSKSSTIKTKVQQKKKEIIETLKFDEASSESNSII